MSAFFKLIRPCQYIKNLLVFFPIFFALKITDVAMLKGAFMAFISFCLAASAVYILNDIKDIERDRLHPKKKKRPLANNEISLKKAALIDCCFFVFSIAFALFIGKNMLIIISVYFIINVFYSFGMKNVAILDIFSISTGFLLRLISGTQYGAVQGVVPSRWIIIMTFLLSLFLAIAKRRDDLILSENGPELRKSISGYSIEFIDSVMSIMSAVIIVAYLLYTLDPEVQKRFSSDVYSTSFFVILAIFRYLQITLVYKKSGNPTEIVYKDRFLQLTILCWFASFLFFAY